MSYEDRMLRNALRKKRESQRNAMPTTLDWAMKKVDTINRDTTQGFQAPHFVDVYGTDTVLSDMHYVGNMRKKFSESSNESTEQTKKAADVLEAIIQDQANTNSWLGDGVTVKKTSAYDDIKNGVDAIAEYPDSVDGSRVLALGIDVTFGTNSIERKFDRIKKQIDEDRLARVKYFESNDGNFKGTRNNIPRTIIGLSIKNISDLARNWSSGEHDWLATHPAQFMLLQQIDEQLKHMITYAQKKRSFTAERELSRSLQTIEKIFNERENFDFGEDIPDRVHQEILRVSRETFRS